MNRITRFAMLLLIWFMPIVAAVAGGVASLRITQAVTSPPNVVAYLDVRDEAEKVVPGGATTGNLTATVGTQSIKTESIIPFSNSGEGIAYIFLVDISKSLKEDQFKQVRDSLNNWVDALGDKDRAAILTFGSTVKLLQDFSSERKDLKKLVAKLQVTDNQTYLHQALLQAMELGRRKDAGLPRRRVIVILSDGIDDSAGSVTSEEVFNQMSMDRIPIYAIGFAGAPLTPEKQEGLKAIGRFARTSGGSFIDANNGKLATAYNVLRQTIREAFIAVFSCQTCNFDGRLYRLQITLVGGTRTLSDGADIRLLPSSDEKPMKVEAAAPNITPQPFYDQYLIPGAVAVTVLTVLLLFMILRRRHGNEQNKVIETQEAAIPEEINFSPSMDTEADKTIKVTAKPVPDIVPGGGQRIRLTVVAGIRRGAAYDALVRQQLVVGRSSKSDLAIDDDIEISTRHCLLRHEGKNLFIKDLGSTNGTLVNGVPLTGEAVFQDGDLVTLGRTELRLSLIGNES